MKGNSSYGISVINKVLLTKLALLMIRDHGDSIESDREADKPVQ